MVSNASDEERSLHPINWKSANKTNTLEPNDSTDEKGEPSKSPTDWQSSAKVAEEDVSSRLLCRQVLSDFDLKTVAQSRAFFELNASKFDREASRLPVRERYRKPASLRYEGLLGRHYPWLDLHYLVDPKKCRHRVTTPL